jgi:hypothetical protein
MILFLLMLNLWMVAATTYPATRLQRMGILQETSRRANAGGLTGSDGLKIVGYNLYSKMSRRLIDLGCPAAIRLLSFHVGC